MTELWIAFLVMSIALLLSVLGSMRDSKTVPAERPPVRAPYQVGDTVCVLHGACPFVECGRIRPMETHAAYIVMGIEFTATEVTLVMERRETRIN